MVKGKGAEGFRTSESESEVLLSFIEPVYTHAPGLASVTSLRIQTGMRVCDYFSQQLLAEEN